MLVLGLLLIIGASVITVGAVFDAGETATVEILGQTVTTTAAGVFAAGAGTMLMFLVGVWALMASMGRAKRKRSERKVAKARQRDSVSRLEEERTALRAENDRLAEQLATRQSPAAGGTAGAAGGAAAGGATAGGVAAGTTPHEHDGAHDAGAHDDGGREPGTHPAGHDDRSGTKKLMDRVTGRADSDARERGAGHDTSATPGAEDHQSDRVVDHNTDLTSRETTTSGRHRDPL